MADNTTWIPNYWYTFIEHSSQQHATTWGRWMRLIVLPLVLLIGFPGNALSATIMSRRSMRRHSYTIILQTLAIFDTSSLIIRLLFWINLLQSILSRDGVVTIQSLAGCKATEYFFTSIHIVCSWLVVLISMERFLVVCFPIRSRQWCTRKTSRIAVAILVTMAFTLQSYSAILTQYAPQIGCVMAQNHMYAHFIIATIFVTFAPLALIFLCNIGIIVCLFSGIHISNACTRDAQTRKVTYMLLSVSCSFLVLVFPNALVVLLIGLRQDWAPVLGQVLEPLALLWDINFGINFYIYVLSGKEVRNEVKDMFGCRKSVRGNTPGVKFFDRHRRRLSLDINADRLSWQRNTSQSSLSTPSTVSTISWRSSNERFT
ncbi:putative olfactory receptor 10J6 [Lineus longissimus]|uniref:putative olfactory receptor 10J6 n=1 Tax=Lineus longissimus TaxID=88925 RepID=UPI00315DF473